MGVYLSPVQGESSHPCLDLLQLLLHLDILFTVGGADKRLRD